jgi:predicted DNA-binding transcriptional regulator AlpA
MNVNTADLLDAGEVAQILGLSSANGVSVYRGRYDDFPAPVIEKASGKCVLWRREDVEAWARATGRPP